MCSGSNEYHMVVRSKVCLQDHNCGSQGLDHSLKPAGCPVNCVHYIRVKLSCKNISYNFINKEQSESLIGNVIASSSPPPPPPPQPLPTPYHTALKLIHCINTSSTLSGVMECIRSLVKLWFMFVMCVSLRLKRIGVK